MNKPQPGLILKPCNKCGIKTWLRPRQRTCQKCQKEAHYRANEEWLARSADEKAEAKNVKKAKLKKAQVSFEVKGGKWYWKAANGLSNGPFLTMWRAKKDATIAI